MRHIAFASSGDSSGGIALEARARKGGQKMARKGEARKGVRNLFQSPPKVQYGRGKRHKKVPDTFSSLTPFRPLFVLHLFVRWMLRIEHAPPSRPAGDGYGPLNAAQIFSCRSISSRSSGQVAEAMAADTLAYSATARTLPNASRHCSQIRGRITRGGCKPITVAGPTLYVGIFHPARDGGPVAAVAAFLGSTEDLDSQVIGHRGQRAGSSE